MTRSRSTSPTRRSRARSLRGGASGRRSRRLAASSRSARMSRSRGSGRGCTERRERRDARWNVEHQVVEFGVEIGEYRGVVRVPRRVFQRLLPERPIPERCVEAYYLQRTRFESIVERKLPPPPVDRGWEC